MPSSIYSRKAAQKLVGLFSWSPPEVDEASHEPAARTPSHEERTETATMATADERDQWWSRVEEVAPGLYRSEGMGDAGEMRRGDKAADHPSDDRSWFLEWGLDICDFKVAEVEIVARSHFPTPEFRVVRRLRVTYSRIDDFRQRVTLPWRGERWRKETKRGGAGLLRILYTLKLGPTEDIVDVCAGGGSRLFRFKTNRRQSIEERFNLHDRSKYEHVICYCPKNMGHVVAGFWGCYEKSIYHLGVYIKRKRPMAWSPKLHWQCPQSFRQVIRELLLAFRRLERDRGRCRESDWGLGRLPLALVLKVVEKLNEQEVGDDRESEQMLCPFLVGTDQSDGCTRTDLRRRLQFINMLQSIWSALVLFAYECSGIFSI